MIKINSLELDDVKRIKAVKLEPSENGLTIKTKLFFMGGITREI